MILFEPLSNKKFKPSLERIKTKKEWKIDTNFRQDRMNQFHLDYENK